MGKVIVAPNSDALATKTMLDSFLHLRIEAPTVAGAVVRTFIHVLPTRGSFESVNRKEFKILTEATREQYDPSPYSYRYELNRLIRWPAHIFHRLTYLYCQSSR